MEHAEEAPVVKKTTYRGKAGQKKRDTEHRERKGAEAMKANDARIEQSLFSNLSLITQRLKQHAHDPSPQVDQISQTTRGLGLATLLSVQWAYMVKPNLNIDTHVVYRTTLAYHYYQMSKASQNFETRYRPVPAGYDYTVEPFNGFNQVVESNLKTFAPIAAALTNFGNCEFDGAQHHGFTPFYSQKITVEDDDVEMVEAASGKRSSKKVRKTGTYSLNPYIINFKNLRGMLEELSTEATPMVLRMGFLDRNPIPGLNIANHVCTNANAIMPVLYGQADLSMDFMRLAAWRDILISKQHAFPI